MGDQPRVKPLGTSDFFADGQASRPLVAGTVPRGPHRDAIIAHSRHFLTGLEAGQPARDLPAEVRKRWERRELLERGRVRYEAFCSHCHDLRGTGQGFVPRRGYPQPPTYHSDRLRAMPLGYFFGVITDGKGRMPAHAGQIPPADRWAIAAFVRTLQFSQYADVSSLEGQDLRQLEASDAKRPIPEGTEP